MQLKENVRKEVSAGEWDGCMAFSGIISFFDNTAKRYFYICFNLMQFLYMIKYILLSPLTLDNVL